MDYVCDGRMGCIWWVSGHGYVSALRGLAVQTGEGTDAGKEEVMR